MTYLAIPLSAENIEQLKEHCDQAKSSGAEVLEFRADYLKNLTLDLFEEAFDVVRSASLPIIVTCRDVIEGGQNGYSPELRLDVLCRAIEKGANYIDCEYVNFRNHIVSDRISTTLSESDCRLILSIHNFKTKFDDLELVYDNIVSLCPYAIAKIVYTPAHLNDCFEAFDLLHNNSDDDVICICMGKAGLASRILAKKLGAFLTFASLDSSSGTAPGQVDVKSMKDLYRFDSITPETKVFGLIANPVGHSLSPAIHNACFEKASMDCVYLPFMLEGEACEFNQFIDNVCQRPWLDFHGFSVSIPHKSNAMECIVNRGQYIEPLAARIGAVNTFVIGFGSHCSGFNTDYLGAMHPLEKALGGGKESLAGKDVAVIGAGGVARAIVAGLTDANAKVTIYNRTASKAQQLGEEFKCHYAKLENYGRLGSESTQILINCTSVGMYPNVDNCPIPGDSLHKDMIVFDTIYNPRKTMLLKNAESAGAKTISGVEMFVAQAMEQFEHFTQQKGDEQLMRNTVFDWLS